MKQQAIVSEQELLRQQNIRRNVRQTYGHRNLSYHIQTYGCQMNDHDSERLAGMLGEMGFAPAPEKSVADLVLFNTCCVREHAESRVFGNVGALKAAKCENPNLIIGVCGCMMQQQGVAQRLFARFPFVDLVFGTHNLYALGELLQGVLEGRRQLALTPSETEIPEGLPAARQQGFSTNLTIMHGCDNYCSYCIVPYVRGRERSRVAARVVAEAEQLAAQGYREITLLGQNVNSYLDPQSGVDFPGLLALVNGVPGIERIRFMTSHPKDLSPALIDAMATLPKVCNHIHLPVQSGSDRILAAMNRRYTAEVYLGLLAALRARVAGIEVTTDVIVGFPGEGEEDFEATLRLVRAAGFAAAFTFLYSPRRGTTAASMPYQVAAAVKKERLLRLNEVQQQETRKNNQKYLGAVVPVLVEGVDERTGRTALGKMTNFKMVYFPGGPELIGRTLPVRVTGMKNNSLQGEQEQA